jgi:protoporphyrinogen oxidase
MRGGAVVTRKRVVVVGGGFTGLSAALDLSLRHDVTVVEASATFGGLASTFEINGVQLEKFYHHWFTSDQAIMALIDDLGATDRVQVKPTATGSYYANRHYRLSTPLDLLRFDALSPIARIRLGIQTLRARTVRDWRSLEGVTAEAWLRSTGGDEVFEKVWSPLLAGKFGPFAGDVGAVWFWNKLKLRGGSRGRQGREELAYFEGGFGALIDLLVAELETRGVQLLTETRATGVVARGGHVTGVVTDAGELDCDACLLTPALPIVADLLRDTAGVDDVAPYEGIDYLANVCLVLHLDRRLSSTYWLNVNDPSFPFVGVIEHTNFIGPDTYGGANLVYLSKYLPHTDALYALDTPSLLDFALPHLTRMFPEFRREWVIEAFSWRARYAQPVVGTHYSARVPPTAGAVRGLHIASMAQIYPEDRGTNYAVRLGRAVANEIA